MPASQLPLTDLRASPLDTLSLPFTKLNLFTSCVHLPEFLCVRVKIRKKGIFFFRGGLCSSIFIAHLASEKVCAPSEIENADLCWCVCTIERGLNLQGVTRVAYQNTSGWAYGLLINDPCPKKMEEVKSACVGGQAKSSISICSLSPEDNFHMFQLLSRNVTKVL